MTTTPKLSIIYTTFSNQEQAENIASWIIENRLAACVNIFPHIKSMYRWQGQIVKDDECSMIIKTLMTKKDELIDWLLKNHPYETPAILHQECDVSKDFFSYVNSCIAD